MKLKYFALILVLIPAVLISGCTTIHYTSLDKCNSDCTAKEYEEGSCLWPTEGKDYENSISIGGCFIEKSRHCGNTGQCECFCLKSASEGSKECLVNSDCVVFGETGDCNCGCYNKDNLPSGTGGECFCAAPDSCKCVNNKCEGFFEDPEQACINSGGIVRNATCCLSTGDFPNNCVIGACGCSLENSHEVKDCDCGEGKCFDGSRCVPEVHSFEDCTKAGYPVMESYPRQCKTPDGRTFVEGETHCIASTGESMSLFKAKQIAMDSECGNQFKETYECNAGTGTWWIDLDIEKEGCNPACIINIKTKEASINWRCTGVLPD